MQAADDLCSTNPTQVENSKAPRRSPPKTMMRAARLGTDGAVRVEDVPIPMPGPGEALVRILQAGICNTDIEIASRGWGYSLRDPIMDAFASILSKLVEMTQTVFLG
jgi:hypothetical protein